MPLEWLECHDKLALELYAGLPECKYKWAALAKSKEWPAEFDKRELREKLRKLLQVGGRLNKVGREEWSAAETRRLKHLVDCSKGKYTWAAWAQGFRSKTPEQRRNKARVEWLGLTSEHRCWYGKGSNARCANVQADEYVTFQKVPDNAAVLRHMGVHQQWSRSMICCSDHGQDASNPMTGTNLPSRASQRRRPDFGSPKPRGIKRELSTPSPGTHQKRARREIQLSTLSPRVDSGREAKRQQERKEREKRESERERKKLEHTHAYTYTRSRTHVRVKGRCR